MVEILTFTLLQPTPIKTSKGQSLDKPENQVLAEPQTHSSSSVTKNSVCNLELSQVDSSSAEPVPRPPSQPLPATKESLAAEKLSRPQEKRKRGRYMMKK